MDGLDLRARPSAAATTRDVTIAAGNLGALPAVLRQTAPAERYVVVADDHTWKVAGRVAPRWRRTAGGLRGPSC